MKKQSKKERLLKLDYRYLKTLVKRNGWETIGNPKKSDLVNDIVKLRGFKIPTDKTLKKHVVKKYRIFKVPVIKTAPTPKPEKRKPRPKKPHIFIKHKRTGGTILRSNVTKGKLDIKTIKSIESQIYKGGKEPRGVILTIISRPDGQTYQETKKGEISNQFERTFSTPPDFIVNKKNLLAWVEGCKEEFLSQGQTSREGSKSFFVVQNIVNMDFIFIR